GGSLTLHRPSPGASLNSPLRRSLTPVARSAPSLGSPTPLGSLPAAGSTSALGWTHGSRNPSGAERLQFLNPVRPMPQTCDVPAPAVPSGHFVRLVSQVHITHRGENHDRTVHADYDPERRRPPA